LEGGDDILEDYGGELPGEISVLENPRAIAINYSRGVDFAREIALKLVDRFECLVDTDCGLLIDGHGFAALVRHFPDWDWREAPDPRPGPSSR